MNPTALRDAAARAATLHERLSPAIEPVGDPTLGGSRLQAWHETVATGDPQQFRRRLAWDGLDEAAARRLAGPVRLRDGAPLPAWASALSEVLDDTAVAAARHDRCLGGAPPVPFEAVLAPVVRWARRVCAERSGAGPYRRLGDAVHTGLERQLLSWLSVHAARVLLLEFAVRGSSQDAVFDRWLAPQASTARYDAFVDDLLAGGLAELLTEYCVLARVLTTTAELWAAATAELLRRFDADESLLRSAFGLRGDVSSVTTSLSDPHRGMRSVTVLALDSGQRVVYKPRSLALEADWNALLGRLGALGAPVRLREFRVLDRGDYGWAEYVESAPCQSAEAATRYFTRAGALLALVRTLGGTDCHADNLVAAGEHPVLVDGETLFAPRLWGPTGVEGAHAIARRRVAESVLATYLLPVWSRTPHDAVFDGSAFGMDAAQQQALTRTRWVHVNEDRMRLERVPGDATPPALAGSKGRVEEHERELVEGFAAMHRFLARVRGTLLDGAHLRRAEVRFVHRSTSLYALVLERLRDPQLLRDGSVWSIEIEQLAVSALRAATADGRTGWIAIWNAERAAIERGDVPYFSVPAGGVDLALAPGDLVPGWFERSGYEVAIERLERLDDDDLALQIDLIRSALRSRSAKRPPRQTRPRGAAPAPGDARWVEAGLSMAHTVAAHAIAAEDGSTTWLPPLPSHDAMRADGRSGHELIGDDLYEGAAGIGLFLAAAGSVGDDPRLSSTALACVRPLLSDLDERGDEVAGRLGIGGLSGLASVVYGLVGMHALLGDGSLLDGARSAARLITTDRIAADTHLDVSSGAGGALLGLLALHAAGGGGLDGAAACGERILAALEPAPHGGLAARTLGGRPLSGFAHGAAGLAYALCRLQRETGDSRLADAASQLVAFERGVYSARHRNWPDLRFPESPHFATGWCHGAPGIARSRLATLPELGDEVTLAELARALELTLAVGGSEPDDLCCGLFGRVDTLAVVGERLGRPDVVRHGRELAWAAVQAGDYALRLPSVGALVPRGLFQGLSGIGYTLLRLGEPAALPDVLVLG
jgi:type 2 lantibiotic biosynthesis protein LanM